MATVENAYRWQWKNAGTEDIEPFAPFRVRGVIMDAERGAVLEGHPADENDAEGYQAINAQSQVKRGKYGKCFFPDACIARVVSSAGNADDVGDKLGQDRLMKDRTGFRIVGDPDADGLALVIRDIAGGATMQGAFARIPGTVPETSPGAITPGEIKPGGVSGSIPIYDWKRGDDGEYLEPPDTLVPLTDDDGAPITAHPVNCSCTAMTAVEKDLLVPGLLQTIGSSRMFIIASAFDLRSLPGMTVTLPDGQKIQIPFRIDGAYDFTLGGKECPPPETPPSP